MKKLSNTGTELKKNVAYISLYSVRMRENRDQENSEYGHFHAVCAHLKIFNSVIMSFSPDPDSLVEELKGVLLQ